MPSTNHNHRELCEEHHNEVERRANLNAELASQRGYLRAITVISGLGLTFLAYSSLVQVPNIRTDMAKEISKLEKADQSISSDLKLLRTDVDSLQCRVTKLEKK